MIKLLRESFFFAALISFSALLNAAAADLRLPGAPGDVEVPAASPAAADAIELIGDYDEIYSALKVYSSVAYVSPQDSPEYLEAAAAGQYLRGRLEEVRALIQKETGRDYKGPASRGGGEVSYRISAELNDVFGFYARPAARDAERGVPIKAGYCQINYVKNNVPFLVQYDGFLKKGEVILTFDDGPGALTEEVSAGMKAGNAPSIFFVLGRNIAGAAGKGRIKAEAADGHSVAVHGYNHAAAGDKPLTAMSTGESVKQLGGVKASIKETTGAAPQFFRPPYGIVTVEQLRAADSELGLVPVGWTIDTLDWSTKDPEELFQKTVSMIKQRGKGIVLMHDIHSQSRTASIRLVAWLADNGYTVVSPERLTKAYRGE
ncbi:MAG: polysaccharide deacetylase family protein [Elusimicrobiales bacterium]|nr:polysaccharide deacetylase family protein [Elusimicrobiales bacterium]